MHHTTPTPTSMLRLLRDLVPNRAIARHEHRRIAELQANRLRSHLGLNHSHLVTEAISELPHIRVRFDDQLPTSGMSYWDGHRWNLLLNPTEPETRQRFTLLHELHHVICHTKRGHLFGKGSAVNDPRAEAMADYFAACALMPKRHMKRLHGQGIHDAEQLAQQFEVSVAAMTIRLDHLGLSESKRTQRCRVSTNPTGRPHGQEARRR